MPSATPSRLCLSVLLIAIVLLSSPAIAVAQNSPSSSQNPHGDPLQRVAQETTPANNSSQSQHENPSRVDEDGEISDVQQWLTGRLSARLGSSTVKLSQGQYQQAKSVLGDDYNQKLGRYVDVAGETDSSQDDNTAEQFQNASQNQREYVSDVQNFRQTYTKYQQAKQNGNQTRARTLARRLNNLQSDINKTGTNLTQNYGNLSNSTGANLERETNTITNTTKNISEQAAQIQAQEFTETNLTAEPAADQVSYGNQLMVSGQLTSDNGTQLADRRILLELAGGRVVTAQTDDDGIYVLNARPRTLAVGSHELTVKYVPQNNSVYAGSNQTINVAVSQTSTNLTLQNKTTTATYNETYTVSGDLTAADRPASDIPVAILVDGVQRATVTTTANGSFSASRVLPASIPPGNHTIRVTLPFNNRALASTNATAPLSVQPTETSLTLTTENQTGRQLTVTGQLTTASGMAVSNQPITIRAAGEALTTVKTTARGRYQANITIPESVAASATNRTVHLSARYSGSGSNLNASQGSAQVQLPRNTESDWMPARLPYLLLSLLGLGLIGMVALWRTGLLQRSEDNLESPDTPDDTLIGPSPPDADQHSNSEPSTPAAGEQQINQAKTALSNGDPDEAVLLAYRGVREALSPRLAIDENATHWEFYTATQSLGLSREMDTTLEKLTTTYERAAFAPNAVSQDTAQTAVEQAISIVKETNSETA